MSLQLTPYEVAEYFSTTVKEGSLFEYDLLIRLDAKLKILKQSCLAKAKKP